jgi:hypothetical protein
MIRSPNTQQLLLATARRLLTLADRDPLSPTYGCFDREFWHYKTLRDFPSGALQMALLPLAILYRTPFPGNVLAGDERVLHLVLGAARYWARLARQGCVDEWYPGERSQSATATTTYAIAEAIRVLSQPGPGVVHADAFSDVLPALKRAGDWLAGHPDDWVANHRAAACAALETLHVLTGAARYRDAARVELAALLARQDPEGWFPEYGSADPGYLGITCAWLARYHLISQDQRSREALDRGLAFLSHFLGPGGAFAGPIGVRDAAYLPLSGSLLAPAECASARPLAARCVEALWKGQLLGPEAVDDRQLTGGFAADAAQALTLGVDPGPAAPVGPHAKHLPRAGLVSLRTADMHLMVGLAKGGALMAGAVREDQTVLFDAGWQALDVEGDVWTSSWPGSSQVFALTLDPAAESSVEIDGPFHRMDYSRPLERMLLPFRLFTTLFADSEMVMGTFTRWAKGPRLLRAAKGSLSLRRVIRLSDRQLTISDRLSGRMKTLARLRWGGPLTARFSPTAKMWATGELETVEAPPEILSRAMKALNARGEARVTLKVTVAEDGSVHKEFREES